MTGWEHEHEADPADDLDRYDLARGVQRLTLQALDAQMVAAPGARHDDVVLTFRAVDGYGAAFVPPVEVDVAVVMSLPVAAALVGELASAVLYAADHDPPAGPH